MKTSVTIAALVLSSIPLWAADCDCIYPIKPKSCVPPCRNALLMKLAKDDLTDTVKLNETTASKVVSLRTGSDSESFAGLVQYLPPKEAKEIQTKFEKLDSAKGTELVRKYEITGVKSGISKEDSRPAWSTDKQKN